MGTRVTVCTVHPDSFCVLHYLDSVLTVYQFYASYIMFKDSIPVIMPQGKKRYQ